jgi:hypothetical protein
VTENLPDRIDRAALERVIQRAAELQTGERDIGDGLTPSEVVALGKEVGIPERYLKQALLEEHGRVELPASRGLLDRAMGAGRVTTQRVVRGDPDGLAARLLTWMGDEELLTVQRKQPGRISWEPVRGVAAALRKSSAVFSGNKSFMLSRAELVTATITGLEPGFSQVALAADLRQARGALIGGASALLGCGVAATVVLAVMSPFWWVALAPAPLFVGLGWGVSRQFRPVAERALLGLERALDHLERGEVKPSHALPPRAAGLLGAVLDEVRKAMK